MSKPENSLLEFENLWHTFSTRGLIKSFSNNEVIKRTTLTHSTRLKRFGLETARRFGKSHMAIVLFWDYG